MPASDREFDHKALGQRLIDAVREAGELARGFPRPLKTWIKGHDSPVTEADIAANDVLKRRLSDPFPEFGWLSEESADDLARLDARCVWIIDPIDGTRAFMAERSDWSVSAALVADGKPVLGAVFAPAEDAMYFAQAGAGARCNDVPLAVSAAETLGGARIAGPKRHIERLQLLAPDVVAEPRVHSLALRLARVAQGALDAAFVSSSSRDWDLAAADLLVHEARGALTTLAGEPLVYNRREPVHGALMAAGRPLLRTLTRVLGERRTELR